MAQYVMTMNRVSKIVPPKRQILKDISLSFFPGAKIGVLGLNGAGKSTLLKIMAGVDKDIDGEITWLSGLKIGYLPQEPQLDPEATVRACVEEGMGEVMSAQKRLEEVYAAYAEPDADFDALAAEQAKLEAIISAAGTDASTQMEIAADALRLPPWDAVIKHLSGGEKRRVALCRLLLSQPDMLLLDEPTNHLDMDSREVLEDALENFPGTILAISHDRYFINRFATKVCVLEAGGVKEYLGNYDDYFEKINRQQAPDSENAGMTKTAMDKEKRKSREEEKRIREKKNAIAAAEKAIATAEEEAAEMEAQLADPATYQDAEKAAQLAKAYQLKKDEIERRYAEWEALSAEE